MTTVQPAVLMHRKRYRDAETRRDATANYRWLAGLDSPLRLPRLVAISGLDLHFERVAGRHARPTDLVGLARHLGDVHGAAYVQELHRARLPLPYRTALAHVLPGFPQRRVDAVARELGAGHVPSAALTVRQAQRLLASADGPAVFYKDANPRNFLITVSGPVTIDFDELTLAPFGYDLAKLVVTAAMTYGILPEALIGDALAAYNTGAGGHWSDMPAVTWEQLMDWAEIHHILTSRYAAGGRYRHSWHQVRPSRPAAGEA
jgi:aminoglycoside phosphotransferase (APT) family kinase protein